LLTVFSSYAPSPHPKRNPRDDFAPEVVLPVVEDFHMRADDPLGPGVTSPKSVRPERASDCRAHSFS